MNTDKKPTYAWEDQDEQRRHDVTAEHEALAQKVAADLIYGPRMIAAFAAQIRGACLMETQPIAEQMREAAAAIAAATGNQMKGELELEIAVYPGVLTAVRFTASTGDTMKKGALGYRSSWGDTPAAAAAGLIDELQAARVSEKIRVHFLRQRAEELGYTIVKADGSKAED
jgi:hypothetical protein